MIFGFVKGQQFSISQPIVVANSNDYLEMKFIFQTADWNGLSIWAHFTQDEKTVFEINVKDNVISKSDRLNLSEGKWKVYLHGNDPDGTMRITTEVKELTVKKAGFICAPMPEIPLSAAEQIDQKAQRAENIANQALTEVKKVAPLEEEARKSMVQAQTSASEAKLSETNAKASEIAAGEFADTAKIAAEQATIAAQASESNAAKTDSDRQIAEQSVLQNTDIAKAINADVVKNDALCKQVEADTAQVAADKATVISAKDAAVQAAQSAESSKTSAGKSAIDAKASADTAGLKLQQTTQAMQNINALTERAESAESIATTKANEALASANLAKQSETMATNSAGEAVESARQALESQKAAALSEAESLKQANLAKESQIAAQTSQTSALQNANEAKESAAKALESANGANGAATTATEQADKATAEAGKATTAATQAEGFAQRAEAGATAAEQAIPEVKKYVADNFANAFRNQISGEVIAVDDVSPVEHEVNCRVESKNLLPYPYPERNPSEKNGVKFNCRDDGIIDISGKSTGAVQYDYVKNMELTPGIYTLSGFSNSVFSGKVARIYVRGSQDTIAELRSIDAKVTFILDHTENVKIYLLLVPAGVNVSGNIALKLERGNTATPYTSYIPDLSKVKVSRVGKNLFDGVIENGKINPEDGSLVSGDSMQRIKNFIPVLPNTVYTLSRDKYSANMGVEWVIGYDGQKNGVLDGNKAGFASGIGIVQDTDTSITFKTTSTTKYIKFFNTSISLEKRMHQVALGNESNIVEYTGCNYTPLSSGEVQGMTSLSPNMTILSDTPGVIINAEYNLDGKKYIDKKVEELKNAVLSLGGNI